MCVQLDEKKFTFTSKILTGVTETVKKAAKKAGAMYRLNAGHSNQGFSYGSAGRQVNGG